MTYPVFAASDILLASDMNAVGLWKITDLTATFTGGTAGSVTNGTVTIGTNNTAVTVSSAFSSNYDNYKIVVAGGAASTGLLLNMTFGAAVTGYYVAANGFRYDNVASLDGGVNNGSAFIGALGEANGLFGIIEVFQPNKAARTSFWCANAQMATTAGKGANFRVGYQDSATAFTSFTLTCSTGNISGGVIRVYGYRD